MARNNIITNTINGQRGIRSGNWRSDLDDNGTVTLYYFGTAVMRFLPGHNVAIPLEYYGSPSTACGVTIAMRGAGARNADTYGELHATDWRQSVAAAVIPDNSIAAAVLQTLLPGSNRTINDHHIDAAIPVALATAA